MGKSRRESRMRIAMFCLTAIVILAILELALRQSGRLVVERNERIAVYQYDAELGWFGIPNSSTAYSDSLATFEVQNNSWGFRDREHGSKTKPRIAVLGDSYVWGMHVRTEERFTDRLQNSLPDWEVINLGVSGYGTDQELLVARKYLPRIAPDLVFLMFCVANDFEDNASNAVNKGYYKPYFIIQNGILEERGVPVPKALGYFIHEHPAIHLSYLLRRLESFYFQYRNPEIVNSYSPTRELIAAVRECAETQRAGFAVGLTQRSGPSLELMKHFDRQSIPYVEVATDLCYRRLGWHWTSAGNRFVSDTVLQFLRDRNLIPSLRDSSTIDFPPAASRR